MATAEACRRHGISGQAFYRRQAGYCGMTPSAARRLKTGSRLRKLLAEALLELSALQNRLRLIPKWSTLAGYRLPEIRERLRCSPGCVASLRRTQHQGEEQDDASDARVVREFDFELGEVDLRLLAGRRLKPDFKARSAGAVVARARMAISRPR